MSELSDRAHQIAEWAFDVIGRVAHTPNQADRRELLHSAAVQARIGEQLAMLDLADSNRELARAHDRLALSYDAMVDELRAKRGVREAA